MILQRAQLALVSFSRSPKLQASFSSAQGFQNTNLPGPYLESQRAHLVEQLQAQEILLDLTITPFEPLTPGNGQNTSEKKEKLAHAIKERIPQENLERLRRQLAGRLVGITVVFLLWKGSPNITNTRPVKDLDNLLKIVFDVLRQGAQGLGIIEEDSYIGEVYATKQLVDTEDQEGYRIIIEEHHDPEMLRTLNQYYSKIPS